MAGRSKASVCGRSPAEIVGSNPTGDLECLSVVSAVYFQVEVSATGRSLVQRSPADCGVFECDREDSIMRKLWPTGGCRTMKEKIKHIKLVNKQKINKYIL